MTNLSALNTYLTATNLEVSILGRPSNIFLEDLEASYEGIGDKVTGKNILIIGGAGSIGSEVVKLLLHWRPATIDIVDRDENSLADLIRDIRSSNLLRVDTDIQTMPFDYGSKTFFSWANVNRKNYDIVMNFAALKHVRSEKDPHSCLSILENNYRKLGAFFDNINLSEAELVFSVSTDKAANPTSVMGVSKRLMEHLVYHQSERLPNTRCLTARFANVAFSNGSLLKSWQRRFGRQEALAVPGNCKRYFISPREAGLICILSISVGRTCSAIIPKMKPADHLLELTEVASKYLHTHGLKPAFFRDELSSKESLHSCLSKREYPVLVTPLDTSGEKPYEEFIGSDEFQTDLGLKNLSSTSFTHRVSPEKLSALSKKIDDAALNQSLKYSDILDIIASIEPDFASTNNWSMKNLDDRM